MGKDYLYPPKTNTKDPQGDRKGGNSTKKDYSYRPYWDTRIGLPGAGTRQKKTGKMSAYYGGHSAVNWKKVKVKKKGERLLTS